jgi:hypothetical protein
MPEPNAITVEDVARLEAELAGLVADASAELDPGDAERLLALGARCDVILELLERLRPSIEAR